MFTISQYVYVFEIVFDFDNGINVNVGIIWV